VLREVPLFKKRIQRDAGGMWGGVGGLGGGSGRSLLHAAVSGPRPVAERARVWEQ